MNHYLLQSNGICNNPVTYPKMGKGIFIDIHRQESRFEKQEKYK